VNFLGGLNSPDRIILVGLCSAKKRHDRITGKLFNKTFIFSNDFCNVIKNLVLGHADLFLLGKLKQCEKIHDNIGFVFGFLEHFVK